MLTLTIGKSTISSLSKILRLFSHTGSSPLNMLQPCSSALGRIRGAVFRMLHTSSSQIVFHSILFLITWTSAPGQKIQEHTCLILWIGILLGIDLAQENIQCMKSFRIECWTTLPLCSSASRQQCLVLGFTCPRISNQCWDQCHTKPLGRCTWPWWWHGTLWQHPYRRGDRINMWCLQVVNRYVWCLSEWLYVELLKVRVNRQWTSPGG